MWKNLKVCKVAVQWPHQVSAHLTVAVQVLEDVLSLAQTRQQLRDGKPVCGLRPPHLHPPAAGTNTA